MISRSRITKKGTRIEVIKLPLKELKMSGEVKIISINNKEDNKNKESNKEDEVIENKSDDEEDLNCQLFWNFNHGNELEDHLEFEDNGMLTVQSEIDMFEL